MSASREIAAPALPLRVAASGAAVAGRRVAQWLVAALAVALALRAALFLAYAAGALATPQQMFVLEGANVHFAWRVQQGLPLYPDGNQYPYTLNYMGPLYYAAVGLLGRGTSADVAGLYLIGRLLSLASGLALAVVVGLFAARRWGTIAGWIAALTTLGAAPMAPFGVMVRPDAWADTLGVCGYLAATCGTGGATLVGGGLLLALAGLTKQTAGMYALAACIALLLQPPTRRRAVLLAVIVGLLTVVSLAMLALSTEPHLPASLGQQKAIPFSLDQFLALMWLLHQRAPELLWFSLAGVVLWCGRDDRQPVLAVLALTTLATTLALVGKRGSDMNYFLALRAVAACGAGTLCAAALRPAAVRWRAAVLLLIGLPLLGPGLLALTRPAVADNSAAQHEAQQVARQLGDRLLTDSDTVAIVQGRDVPLLDPYLFRLRVEQGQLDPAELVARLNRRHFQQLLLTRDPAAELDATSFWRLPQAVREAVTEQYTFQRKLGPWRVYVPRRTSAAAD